ncbi:uncharacterized protein TM35_000151660 [Trypanosoma theileri]|uniref:Uncharacterized protein n=1 Tax=Trypanosoma theileri TaxID=67003 RepID=A0A1X0NVM1_9TRYP|nr:uncharacterized protein TM35_000151660 [Trypanosoma theileri]ORC88735.1 hypothetical protein TM35_000151660 [Trypanosoma theileri]
MWKHEEWDQFGYHREEAIQYLQELFQSKQYNRCVVLVECLLTDESLKNSFISCELLHILVISLLRTERLFQANKALDHLRDLIEYNKEFTQDDREKWRSRYVEDKREASEYEDHLLKAHSTFIKSSNTSSLNCEDKKETFTLSTQQTPLSLLVERKPRRDLCGDAHSLLESTHQFLLQQLMRRNNSLHISSTTPVVVSEEWKRKNKRKAYFLKKKKNIVGDERVELHCMEKALEVLMEYKPFNKAEEIMLFKSIGSLALEYAERLLRAGTVVKAILPHTAENLYLALETMERYLHELPEPFPSFTHSQLKLVRLLIIIGSENFTPFIGRNQFLDHAFQMVEELFDELMEIAPSIHIERDVMLREVWNSIHARLLASILETKGNILTAQNQHQAAVEAFKQSIDKYNIAVTTTTSINTSEYKDIYSYYDEYFKDDNNYYSYMDNVPFRIRLQVKLAEALSNSGHHVESLELLSSLRSSLDTSFKHITSGPMALIMFTQGNTFSGCNRLEEARQSYEMVLAYLHKSKDDLLQAVVMDRLAILSLWCGNHKLSVEYYRHALRLRRRSVGEFHLDTAISHINLSESLFLLYQYKEAEKHADDCMRLVKDLYTGVFARQLYGYHNIFTFEKRNRQVGRFLSLRYDGPSSLETRGEASLYLQHPLYTAAARCKSECIKRRLK